jgi:predicted HAD superfamily phosphohydrolase YqeG
MEDFKKPFNFMALLDNLLQDFDYKIEDPENTVVIGDRLTTDVVFGNLN